MNRYDAAWLCGLALFVAGLAHIHLGLGMAAAGVLLALWAAISEIRSESKGHSGE